MGNTATKKLLKMNSHRFTKTKRTPKRKMNLTSKRTPPPMKIQMEKTTEKKTAKTTEMKTEKTTEMKTAKTTVMKTEKTTEMKTVTKKMIMLTMKKPMKPLRSAKTTVM